MSDVKGLRKSAVLVFRCSDCDGKVIAHVNWRHGKPMLWTVGPSARHGNWTELDGRPGMSAAWCSWGKFWLDRVELLDGLPTGGQVEHRVDHTSAGRYSRKDIGQFRTVGEVRREREARRQRTTGGMP